MSSFIQKWKDKTNAEQKAIDDSRAEVEAINVGIMKTITLACTVIMGLSLLASLFNDTFSVAGFDRLRFAYFGLVIFSFSVYSIIQFYKKFNATLMIYIVNFLAFVYSFVVSALVAPDTITVTYIVVIFMAATLYIDLSWRINCFIVSSLALFLVAISQFKSVEAFTGELINSVTVVLLAIVIGLIVRSARIESLIARKLLHYQAFTDQLTNISNRRLLFDTLNSSAIKKIPYTAFSLLDIDYFKNYNDTYGHKAGDDCLRDIGQCFLELEKRYPIHFYRYGGEEFVITYVKCTKTEIENILTVLNIEIERLGKRHSTSEFGRVTLSIGTVLITEIKPDKYEPLLSLADIALYKAKTSGRNKSLFYDKSMIFDPEKIKSRTRKR